MIRIRNCVAALLSILALVSVAHAHPGHSHAAASLPWHHAFTGVDHGLLIGLLCVVVASLPRRQQALVLLGSLASATIAWMICPAEFVNQMTLLTSATALIGLGWCAIHKASHPKIVFVLAALAGLSFGGSHAQVEASSFFAMSLLPTAALLCLAIVASNRIGIVKEPIRRSPAYQLAIITASDAGLLLAFHGG